jgi:hypothetical protein
MMVSAVVRTFAEVRRWQLRQTGPSTLEFSWCLPRPGSRAAGEIAAQLREKFGRGLVFQVVPVDDIPLAPTGKLQTIVPLAEDAGMSTSSPDH